VAETPARKLAVILHADVVGSTNLVQRDETLAHTRIQDVFHRFSETVELYGGATTELRGDALVAEFSRSSDAVCAAVAFQTENGKFNDTIEDDIRPQLRVGVAMGEVVIADNTVTGPGVVLAQRLEQLSEPGGVCIHDAAYQTVPKRLPFDYESLGEQELKGFEDSVRAYAVKLKPGEAIPAAESRTETVEAVVGKPVWPRIAGGVITFLIVIGGGIAWWQPWKPEFEPASVERMAFPLPDKPSIAVLPFTNMSSDPEQEYFADGITDDLLTELSKLSGLFVTSRNSSFAYKGKAVKINQVAEELGVRYVLEGSVRRASDQVRINAQLIDAATGYHLWAEKFDGPVRDVFALQDNVVGEIAAALALELSGTGPGRSEIETSNPEAYEALLQGMDHYYRQTPEDHAKSIEFFKRAVAIDPGYSRGYAGLALAYWDLGDLEWYRNVGVEFQDAMDEAERNLKIALRKPTALAYQVSARRMLWMGEHDTALAEIDKAIEINPNDPENRVVKAWTQVVSGLADQAETEIRLAMRLNPTYRPNYLRALGYVLFHQERYAEAAKAMERAIDRQPDYRWAYRLIASIYGQLGQTDKAKAAVEKFNTLHDAGDLTVQEVGTWVKWKDRADLERYQEGLRLAGVPEGAAPATGDTDYESLITVVGGLFEVTGVPRIDATAAKVFYDRGAVFVDVRSKNSYNRGHVLNAVNLRLRDRLDEASLSKVVGKGDDVVFYCSGKSCDLSPTACAKAVTWGFTSVYYFAGGIPEWKKAKYPVGPQ
jgi:adenylate cyclase